MVKLIITQQLNSKKQKNLKVIKINKMVFVTYT